MENSDIWYPVNAYGGKWLLAVGLIMALAATGLFFLPAFSPDVYAYAVLVVWVVLFTVALVASVRYMNSL